MSKSKLVTEFFRRSTFAVVGASKDPTKFGNRVLKCYITHEKPVIAIHPKEEQIEGLYCAKSLSTLPSDIRVDLGVSLVTPPAITRKVLEEGLSLGAPVAALYIACVSYASHIVICSLFFFFFKICVL
jgi:uncharacterized protein